MAKNNTIISKLSSKKKELESYAQYQKNEAADLRSQIAAHEQAAITADAQAVAVDKALGILIEAGVTF